MRSSFVKRAATAQQFAHARNDPHRLANWGLPHSCQSRQNRGSRLSAGFRARSEAVFQGCRLLDRDTPMAFVSHRKRSPRRSETDSQSHQRRCRRRCVNDRVILLRATETAAPFEMDVQTACALFCRSGEVGGRPQRGDRLSGLREAVP
jgi:hypothetical protein